MNHSEAAVERYVVGLSIIGLALVAFGIGIFYRNEGAIIGPPFVAFFGWNLAAEGKVRAQRNSVRELPRWYVVITVATVVGVGLAFICKFLLQ